MTGVHLGRRGEEDERGEDMVTLGHTDECWPLFCNHTPRTNFGPSRKLICKLNVNKVIKLFIKLFN